MSTTLDFDDGDELEPDSSEGREAPRPLELFEEPYELAERAIYYDSEEELPLLVPMPTDEQAHGRANLNYGKRYVTDYPPYYGEEALRAADTSVIPGHVEETKDEYLIRWRTRGSPAPSEAEVAKLAAKASSRNESRGRVMTEEFYRDLIFPYVGRRTQTTPFEWAHERARLAVGFTATMALLRETPAAKLTEPFMEIAGKVINAPSPDAGDPKSLAKTPKREALYTALKARIENPSSELIWFILKNEEAFAPEMFEDPRVCAGIAELEPCLANGLNVKRLEEWFKLQSKGENVREALVKSLNLTKAIFANGKNPWWFREDIPWEEWFDVGASESGTCDGVYKLAPDAKGLERIEQIAKATGRAVEYGVALYKKEAWRLFEKREDIDEDRLWKLYGTVTHAYGVGNVPRACNVLRFIREFIEKVPAKDRRKALDKLERHAQKAAPANAIIGRLQGEDAGLHLPGLSALLVTQLGVDRMKTDRVDSSTIQVAHLSDMAVRLARSVHVRAGELPGAVKQKYLDRVRLLTDHTKPAVLLEADSSVAKDCGEALMGLLEFYEHLDRECQEPSRVGDYFAFYAHKMPNPMHPPEGFLKFLEDFEYVSDPRCKYSEFEAPNERHAIREKNAAYLVERHLVISSLIDVWVKGLITEEHLRRILSSLLRKDAGAFANYSVQREYDERAKREVRRARGEDADHVEERTLTLFARYLCLKDSVEVLAVHAALVDAGIMTEEDLRVLTTETALNGSGTRAVRMDKLAKGAPHEELLVCMRAMIASGCANAQDLQKSLHETTLKERMIYSRKNPHEWDKRASVTPDFFTRLSELWYTAYAFKMMHDEASKTKYRDRAVSEIKRHLAMGHFQKSYMRGEVAEVVEGLISNATSSLRSECEKLTMHATIPLDMDAFIQRFFPLYEIGKTFFKVWYELLHKIKIPDSVVIDLIEQVPHTFPLNERGHAILLEDVKGTHLSPTTRFLAGISVLGRKTDQPNPGSPVGRVTDQVVNMVTFTLALSEMPPSLLATLSIDDGVRTRQPVVEPSIPNGEDPSAVLRGALAAKIPYSGSTPRELMAEIVALNQAMETRRPVVMERIRLARENAWGLVPVGGKIHVLHPVNTIRFNLVKKMLGFDSTQFRLDRASTSIIIPPVPSAEESIAMVNMLAQIGILDDEFPELQVTLPGRLPPKDVAILGSFLLLATERGIAYDLKAFSTTHDAQTGARIMAYDAGHTPIDMPFMPPLEGRTDMLGRRDAGDIKIMQRVGTVLLQAHAGKGPFARFAEEFKKRFTAILEAHGIAEVLDGSWIYLPGQSQTDEADSVRHYETVKTCTDAYFACARQFSETEREEGIIFEVRALLEWLEVEIEKEQKNLRESGETCAEEAILLKF